MISKRNPNPQICEQGVKRKSLNVKLSYSLYSDISIVGLPNAGKSTLIQKLTNSKAKIGDYEFTTTSPNIGVLNNSESLITICDLPGLLEGASDGVGMGRRVLKHLRNTKFIIYLLTRSVRTSATLHNKLRAFLITFLVIFARTTH